MLAREWALKSVVPLCDTDISEDFFFSYKSLLHTQSTADPLKNPNNKTRGKKEEKKEGNLTDWHPFWHCFPQGSVSLSQASSEVVQVRNQRPSKSVAVWEQAIGSPVGWGDPDCHGTCLAIFFSIFLLQDCSSVLKAHCFRLPCWQAVFPCLHAPTFSRGADSETFIISGQKTF